jgi:hypothetical protein
MKKRIFALLLAVIMCVGLLSSTAMAASTTRDVSFEESLAADLKEMGLFQGVSDTDFALGRAPTRTEALVMLIRLLGKEDTALNGTWTHPFTDVASWADKYVGYAYENGLTNGISATQFGTGDASAAMYVTFVLRALGYSDTDGEDFTWNNPFDLATEIGIIPDGTDLDNFLRADVVRVSYAALKAMLKNTSTSLAISLFGSDLSNNFYRYYDVNAFRNHSDWFTIMTWLLTKYGNQSTSSSGSTYYATTYVHGNMYLDYTEGADEICTYLSFGDATIAVWFGSDGAVDYVYSESVDDEDDEFVVLGSIFPENYLELENEDLQRISVGNPTFQSERRTVIMKLPSGNYTVDSTYVDTYAARADEAIMSVLITLRGFFKDLDLGCDLTDLGFTNTHTIGLTEQALDVANK